MAAQAAATHLIPAAWEPALPQLHLRVQGWSKARGGGGGRRTVENAAGPPGPEETA